jgi:hypothetical protein
MSKRLLERAGDTRIGSGSPGLTLRDFFAGQALAGLISNRGPAKVDGDFAADAEACYLWADAMLRER